jgi:MOSC domain-containing protein YiiM
MSVSQSEATEGSVASLHLHPIRGGEPMTSATSIEVVEEMGIRGEPRYFGRRSLSGRPGSRQVSLIESEQIAEPAAALGVECISPGGVRANIETFGIKLVPLVGKSIQIGSAVLLITQPRDPCEKMDRICQGLRKLMENDKQGVLARVVRSGTIRVRDLIRLLTVPVRG